nr:MAG TPA_asm: hypothetical protein [Caudoviricetes sp.]
MVRTAPHGLRIPSPKGIPRRVLQPGGGFPA